MPEPKPKHLRLCVGDEEPLEQLGARSARLSEHAALLDEFELLLKRHHNSLVHQVNQSLEDFYVRLINNQVHSSTNAAAVAAASATIASAGVTSSPRATLAVPAQATLGVPPKNRRATVNVKPVEYVRSFSESVNIRRTQAAKIAMDTSKSRLTAAAAERTGGGRKKRISCPNVSEKLSRFVNSNIFEFISIICIVTNTIFFGVETELMAKDDAIPFLDIANIVFTLVFTVELVMRLAAGPRQFFRSKQRIWNMADTIVVVVSLVELYFRISQLDSGFNLSHARIIRVARLVRIFRVIRVLKAFSSLRILVHCVLNSLRSLTWTIFLLTVVVYVFGIIFTQATIEYLAENPQPPVMTDREQEIWDGLHWYYGSLPASMYTLFKSVTGGVSWQDVSSPLGRVSPIMETLFNCFICFTYFAVLNVVTGVFCQSAIESAAHDKDMVVQAQLSNKELYTQQLKDIFEAIDSSHTGQMNFSMLEGCLEDPQFEAYFDALGITANDAWNLFQLLDDDGSNEIDLEEFVEGCLKLRGSARSIDSHMLLFESKWTMNKVTLLCKCFNDLLTQLSVLDIDGSVELQRIELPPERFGRESLRQHKRRSQELRRSQEVQSGHQGKRIASVSYTEEQHNEQGAAPAKYVGRTQTVILSENGCQDAVNGHCVEQDDEASVLTPEAFAD